MPIDKDQAGNISRRVPGPTVKTIGGISVQSDRLELLAFALSLAEAAQAQILSSYRNSTTSYKADGSEVTEADRRAEEVMREMIVKRYPSHAILVLCKQTG